MQKTTRTYIYASKGKQNLIPWHEILQITIAETKKENAFYMRTLR